jgi:hypothetical protein
MSVLYDCYALHQYGSILGIQLTTDVFVELPDDDPMRTKTCSSHEINKLLRVTLVYSIKYCCVDGQRFSVIYFVADITLSQNKLYHYL